MSRDPIAATQNTPLKDVVSLIVAKSIGSVFIVDGENVPVGVYTERELLSDLAARGRIDGSMKVSEKMSKAVFGISPEASVEEAAQVMIERKARLAVTKHNKLVGVVTTSDILKAIFEDAGDRPVESGVSPRVITIDSKGKVLEAVQLMFGKRIGSVIVTKQGKPFGIFTERDLLKVIDREGKDSSRILETSLEEVASKPLISAHPGITFRGAASIMKLKKIKRLPIIQNESIQGIITARDLVELYSKPITSVE
jgi:CBS domain-containing protein